MGISTSKLANKKRILTEENWSIICYPIKLKKKERLRTQWSVHEKTYNIVEDSHAFGLHNKSQSPWLVWNLQAQNKNKPDKLVVLQSTEKLN